MAKKFQDLTVDYKQLLKMNAADRMAVVATPVYGQQTIESLTAEQYARLFPTNYQKTQVASLGTAAGNISEESRRRLGIPETGGAGAGGRQGAGGAGARTASREITPSWMQRVQKETGVNINASNDAGTPIGSAAGKRLISATMNKYGVTNPEERAAMAAVIAGESGFRPISENNYSKTSNARIREVFKGRVGNLSEEQLTAIKADPEKFFNHVYGGRLGNAPDEGYKYRGRGFIQLTGRANYEKYASVTGIPIDKNPDLMNDPNIAAQVSILYMQKTRGKGSNTYERIARGVGNPVKGTEQIKRSSYDQYIRSGEFVSGSSTVEGDPGTSQPSSSKIPEVPQGISPQLLEEYNKMSLTQKRNFHSALGKLDPDPESAIKRMNQIYQQNPQETVQQIESNNGKINLAALSSESGDKLITMSQLTASERAFLRGKSEEEKSRFSANRLNGLNEETKRRLMYAAARYKELTGDTLKVNSAYRSVEHQKFLYENQGKFGTSVGGVGRPGRSPHGFGKALDIPQGQIAQLRKLGILDEAGLDVPYIEGGRLYRGQSLANKERHHVELNPNATGPSRERLEAALKAAGYNPQEILEARRSIQSGGDTPPAVTGRVTSQQEQAATSQQGQTAQQGIFVGGLSHRRGDESLKQQTDRYRGSLGEGATATSFAHNDDVKKIIEQAKTNPNSPITLYSAGGKHLQKLLDAGIDPKRITLAEPFKPNPELMKSFLSRGGNLVYNPGSAERGYFPGAEEFANARSNSGQHKESYVVPGQTAAPTAAQAPTTQSAAPPAAPPAASSTPAANPSGLPTLTIQGSGWSQAAMTAQEREAAGIPVNAEGGEQDVRQTGRIEAKPIGGLRGDNTVVVDQNQKPMFTMNTDKEAANYDPKTGKVSVTPLGKTDGDEINKSTDENAGAAPTVREQVESNRENMSSMQSTTVPGSDTPDYDSILAPYLNHDPSFSRAIATTNFRNEGYHFDWGSKNFA